VAHRITVARDLEQLAPPVHMLLLQQSLDNARALRHLVEMAAVLAGDTVDVWLVFAGEPPAVENMRNCRIIAELSAV
jgi:hypothetical protein